MTLLEIIIAIALLGILLAGLFHCLRQTMQNSVAAREIKQKILQIELIDQRVRSILSHLGEGTVIWLEEGPESVGPALHIRYEQSVDRDPQFCGPLEGTFYLDSKGRFSFASWGQKKEKRLETFIDSISAIRWELFDESKGKWLSEWPKKKAASPAMLRMIITSAKQEIPFVFFLSDPAAPFLFESTP